MTKIKKKYLFFALIVLIIFLGMISTVNASDINETDELSLTVNDELSVSELDNLSVSDDSLIAESDTIIYIGPEGSSTGLGTRDDPYDSIKTALNHVSGKTEVIYLAGTYNGDDNGYQVKISQNDIFIHADDGAEVIMDWGDVYYGSWTFTGRNCAVDGIIFTNTLPSRYSYPMRTIQATNVNNLNITNCNIIVKGGGSYPIYVSGSSNVRIENCTIKHPYDEPAYYNPIEIRNSNNIIINNNTIDSFKSVNQGGGIYIYNTASGDNIIVENNTLTNLGQYMGCGIYYNGKGTNPLTVRNNYFCNATSKNTGTIIYYSGSSSDAKVIIENNKFINSTLNRDPTLSNTAYGGSIYLGNSYSNSEAIIKNNTFINSSIKYVNTDYYYFYGGAVAINMKKISFEDNDFINCSAISGGAVYVDDYGNAFFNNNTFIDCFAGLYGGAISLDYYSIATINDTSFTNCSSVLWGGAIYASNSNTYINNSLFTNCSANREGGAIYSGAFNIVNSTFINNNASNGGAIYAAGKYNISDSFFINNTAVNGGALYIYSSYETIKNTTFETNNAKLGGALYSTYSYNSTYSNNTFLSNNATIGGAIYLEDAENYYTKTKKILIENSTFENNTAYSGGAVVTYMRNSIIANSTFKNNNASHYGGGALISDGINMTILNNTFYNNTAMLYAGAIGVNNSYVANNTFINNTAYQGGAVLTINSTIAYNNFTGNNATRGKDIVYLDTYEYYTTTVKCNCTNCTDCDCTMDNCNCTNASMVEVIEDLLIENIMDEDTVYKYDEKEILRVEYQQNGKYFLYENPKTSYGDYYYWGYCIEENNTNPLYGNGIHVDDLTFVRNRLDQSYVGDYLKVLLIMYQDEIYNLKDYVYVFTEGNYLNSTNEIIKNVINVTNDEFTHLENGNNYVNGSFSCYWFSSFIMPTSRQNILLINSCAPIKLAGISVVKDSSTDHYSPNSDVEYEISVYNSNSNVTLHNVTITDKLVNSGWYIKGWDNIYDDLWVRTGENSWALNRPLLPGEGSAIKVICHIDSITYSEIENTADVFTHETGTVSVTKEIPIKPSTPAPASNIAIKKTSISSPVVVGDFMTYKIVVTNNGNKRSGIITVKDTVSDPYCNFYTWFSDVGTWRSDYQYSPMTFTLTSNGGCLDPGQSASFYIYYRTNVPYSYYSYYHSNTAFVNEDGIQKGSSTASTTIIKPTYHIVKKAGKTTLGVGDRFSYTIDVYYDSYGSNYPLTDISIEDVIPSGLEVFDWDGDGWRRSSQSGNKYVFTYTPSLYSQKSETLIIRCQAKETGEYTNVATATAKVNNIPLDPVKSSADVSVVIPSVYLKKTTANGEYHVGDIVPFTITVKNTYSQTLYNVVVHDMFHKGLVYDSFFDSSNRWKKEEGIPSWKYSGSLSSGASSSFTVYFKATESGTLHNVVTVSSSQGASNESIADVEVLENSITASKLVIEKIINKGSNVTFVINVKNTYNQPLNNVFVRELPEEGLKLVDWKKIKGDWEYDEVNKQFKLSYLAFNDNASFNVTFRGDELGYLYNIIEYGSQQTPTYTAVNNTFVQNPSMEISKITLNNRVLLGEKVGFKIQVKNNGNVPLSHVFINETTFEGLNFTGWENSTRLWTLSQDGGKYKFLLNGNLKVDETASIIVYFNTTSSGNLTNIVVAGSDKTDTYKAKNTTFVEKIALKIEKITLTPIVDIYENATFAINVTNIGETTLTDVVVREMQHDGLQYLNYKGVKGDWEYVDGVFKLNSELIPDDWACFNIIFNATREGRLINTVQGTYNKTRNVTAKNNTLIIHPNMTLEKVTLNQSVYIGENVTFTIVVTNNGFVDLGDVFVEEIEHAGLTDPRFIPNVGRWVYENGVYKLLDVLKVDETASFNITFTATGSGKLTNIVRAKSNETHEITANNTTFVKNPNMTLTKITQNKIVNIGDMVTFQIIVNNTGNIDLADVVVNETVHDGLENPKFIPNVGRWIYEDGVYKLLDILEAGKSASFNITFVSTEYDKLTNIVKAKSNETDEIEANNTTFVKKPELSVQKLVLNKTVLMGENVTFTIVVKNTGNIDLTEVYVNEYLHPGLKYEAFISNKGNWTKVDEIFKLKEILKVNESASFNITFSTTTSGDVINTVIAGSNESSQKTTSNTTFSKNYEYLVEKITLNPIVNITQNVTFRIHIKNIGNMDLDHLILNELPDDGLELIDFIAVKGDFAYIDNQIVLWHLHVDDNATIDLIFNTTKQGQLNNTVIVIFNETTEKSANNTTFVRNPSLKIRKITLNKSVVLGDNVTFTIFVENTGNIDLNRVIITEEIVDGLILLKYIDDADEWLYSISKNVFIFDGVLKAGQNSSFNVIYKTTKTGNLTNIISVQSKDTPEIKANNSTFVDNPVIEIQKLTLNKSVYTNENITFTIIVKNKGNIDLTDVIVSEDDFEGLSYLTYTNGTGKWSCEMIGNKPVFKLIGKLAIGENVTFNVVFKSSTPGIYNNTVVVISNKTEEVTAKNTTEVLPKADLIITKDTSKKTAHIGDLITWTIVVTNNGPDTASNVKVIESIPNGMIYQSITPSKGSFNNITNTWDIGELSSGEKVTLTITTKVTWSNLNLTNVAAVNSSTYDYNMSNNVANNTTEVSPEADLGVIKLICNSTSLPNGKVIWSVVVTNYGPNMAENVVVNDLLPEELELITTKASKGSYANGVWNVGNLANKQTATLVIYTRINKTSGNLTNYVTVESDTYDGNDTNNAANNTTMILGIADLEITKSVSKSSAHIGDEIVWTIVVVNNGPSDAINVKVTESIPNGLEFISADASKGSYDNLINTWVIGKLANGESVTLTIRTLVLRSDVNLTNVALVKSSNYDNDTSNNIANNTTEVSPEADLGVIKLICNSTTLPNGKVIWSVVVTNYGPDMAENVVVNDLLPEELKYITSKASKGSYADGVWNVGNLANKQTATLVIYTRINKTSGNLTNYADVKSDTYDGNDTNNAANNTTTVKQSADLSIIKLVSNKTSSIGDEITWTLIVTNNGPGTAYNIKVIDQLPDGLVFVSASGNYKDGVWTIPQLESGKSVNFTVLCKVNTTGVNITNIACVSSDTPDLNKSNNIAENTTEVLPEAELDIVKVVSNNYVRTGDEITWSIVVVNYGNADAHNVSVLDSIPEGLIYSHYVASNGIYNYTSGTWKIDTLKAHELATLVITTKVANVKKNITNVAILGMSSDNDTVEVDNEVKLNIIKTVSDENPNFGEEIKWTITVFNLGPALAENVKVTDVLPEGLIYVSSDGNYTNGIWYIGDLLNGENKTLIIKTLVNTTSQITNTATVTTQSNNTGNNTANKTVNVKYCDIVAVKKADSDKCYVGEIMTWTIIVTNNGPDDASNVTALDILPKELQYISYTATKGTYDYQSGLWTIGNLANGESVILTITTRVLTKGNITNPVDVSTSTYDANKSNNCDNATVNVLEKEPSDNENSTENESVPSDISNVSYDVSIDEKATGNPIMALIMMLSLIGIIRFKRKK